jgi:hypothetical protein
MVDYMSYFPNASVGKSAYQSAVDTGFQGTEAQWILSLKGVAGERGLQGLTGIQGITGGQGIQGIAGDKGLDGTGVAMIFRQTTDKTVTGSTVQSVIGTGVGNLTLPANFWTVGKQIRIRGRGRYSTPASLSQVTVVIKIGAVTVASVVTTALSVSSTNLGVDFEAIITCRSVGTNGTLLAMGNVNYNALLSGTVLSRIFDDLNSVGATTAINTTLAGLLDVTVQWGGLGTARSLTISSATIESLN